MTQFAFRNVMRGLVVAATSFMSNSSRLRTTAFATALVLGLSGASGCTTAADGDVALDDDRADYTLAQSCADPVEAVLHIMSCIENENAFCASSGYASSFIKLHNGVDTKTKVPGFFFWSGAFYFIDFYLDIDHVALVGDNQVSLRYVETVAFNDGDTFLQHEHAIITVNNSCKMVLWDQYGDNEEQIAVDNKADDLSPF